MGLIDPESRVLLPALAELPGHLFWRAAARVHVSLASVLPPGVDVNAYAVLLALAGGAVRSQQELADTLMISRTTMARVGADLARQGLVDRVRNPRDRRSYALTRTADGAAAARRWRSFMAELESAVTAGFSETERADLTRLLTVLVQSDLPDDLPRELRGSTGFLLTRIHARAHRDFLHGLQPLDLEPRDYGSLRALDALGHVSQAELARAMGVSGPTIVEVADRLEARGLVERRRSPADRRSQQLHLQPRATSVLERAIDVVEDVEDDVFGSLDADELARLVVLLRRLVTAA